MDMETEEYDKTVGSDMERKIWIIWVDGSTKKLGSGIRMQIITPNVSQLTNSIVIEFSASNSETEYEVVLTGMRMAITLQVKFMRLFSDSKLVVD